MASPSGPPMTLDTCGPSDGAIRTAVPGEKVMEWFSRKTSIGGTQIPNWVLVLGTIIGIWLIYQFITWRAQLGVAGADSAPEGNERQSYRGNQHHRDRDRPDQTPLRSSTPEARRRQCLWRGQRLTDREIAAHVPRQVGTPGWHLQPS